MFAIKPELAWRTIGRAAEDPFAAVAQGTWQRYCCGDGAKGRLKDWDPSASGRASPRPRGALIGAVCGGRPSGVKRGGSAASGSGREGSAEKRERASSWHHYGDS
ncbi:hypothetical protein [Spirillospora sp. CA-128828]|uniref:hypothetical protein n=1 Tax=Spirillospora sp. CA-128828 TaxID=3240033 RepID=UPI003D91E711